ncbi:hypothetical protein ACFFRR_003350 [Megaselia abdita]
MSSSRYDSGSKIKLSSVYTKMVSATDPLLGSINSLSSGKSNYGRRTSSMYNYPRSKRGKKGGSWGTKERAGMSFLIVIAFFAVFALIILTEVFVIDDKTRGVVVLQRGAANRYGEFVPDYDNTKEDYDLVDATMLEKDNALGSFVLKVDESKILKLKENIGAKLRNAFSTSNWGQILSPKIEQTLPRFPRDIPSTDGIWRVVNGTRFKFLVYSAFYDDRDGKMVRVIGATKTRGPEKVWCRLWYKANTSTNTRPKYYSASVVAKVKVIRENWNLKYSACFVLCPLRAPGIDVPFSVSVVSRLRAPPANVLLVQNKCNNDDYPNHSQNKTKPLKEKIQKHERQQQMKHIDEKIAICVKPFHFNYDQALYLIEYLELNSLLGIRHFTFYNHTIGPHATCVLNHYIEGNVPGNLSTFDEDESNAFFQSKLKSGTSTVNNDNDHNRNQNSQYKIPTISILDWNLSMRSQKEIRTEGLFAALNDCLYRNMYRYKYLALVDLDEFIIPRHNNTLNDLLNRVNKNFDYRNAGAYSFQNSFFYLQFGDDALLTSDNNFKGNKAVRGALVTQRKTRRRAKLHPHKQRSKYICKPEYVVEAGNHFVWEFVPGKGTLNVPATAGMLHHYRVCEFGGDDCVKAPSVLDRTSTRYVNRLVERVEIVYKYLKAPCKLDNLPPAPSKPPPTSRKVLSIINDIEKHAAQKEKNKKKG